MEKRDIFSKITWRKITAIGFLQSLNTLLLSAFFYIILVSVNLKIGYGYVFAVHIQQYL